MQRFFKRSKLLCPDRWILMDLDGSFCPGDIATGLSPVGEKTEPIRTIAGSASAHSGTKMDIVRIKQQTAANYLQEIPGHHATETHGSGCWKVLILLSNAVPGGFRQLDKSLPCSLGGVSLRLSL
eukprot:s882_g8.t1